MIITHSSFEEINEIEVNELGLRKGCLFFGHEGNEYNLMGECNFQLNVEVDEDNVIEVRRFFFDHAASEVEDVLENMMLELDIDKSTACDLLDGTNGGIDSLDSDGMWIVQQYQGLAAHKLGYDACCDQDEQGEVFIKFMG